jgi:hypothetical protein
LALACALVVMTWVPAALADVTDSANWAGYAVHRRDVSFHSVRATWTQPTVACIPGVPTYSSFWVGIGGYSVSARALEQIGTEVDCTRSGQIRSTAWYELVPAPSMPVRLPVRPGDVISGSVAVGKHRVTLTLDDLTARRGFHRTLRAGLIDRTSAEWIVEAPSACVGLSTCQTLPLANFGSTSFSSASARTSRGHAGTITDGAWHSTKIRLVPQSARFVLAGGGAPLAQAKPSPLQSGGSFFEVNYAPLTVGSAPLQAARRLSPRAGQLVHLWR